MRKLVAGLAVTLDGVVDSPSGNWMRFDGAATELDLRLVSSRTLGTGVISATYARA
jgi:hypothetical protein